MLFLVLAFAAIAVAFLLGLRFEIAKEPNRSRQKLIIRKWLALALWLAAVLFLMHRGLRLSAFIIIGGLLLIHLVTWYNLRVLARKNPPVDLEKMKRAKGRG